jgi:hypothetical protein
MTRIVMGTRASAVLTAAVMIGACGAAGDGGRSSDAAAAANTASQPGSRPVAALKKGNPCSVLLPQEVGEILGVRVTMREIVDESTCSFPFELPASPAGGAPGAAAAKPASEDAAKTMAEAIVGAESQFTITVHWDDGPTAVTAARMAGKLLGGDAGFEKLQGIGDEAWLGPLASILVFSKGKMGVQLDLRLVPDGREKGIRLAKLIASRLP